ncbi:MAG: hypothetical protein MUE41_04830 [Gemmatimonadaceae bacterium]|jgi:hypothetical protein|nr:hypothetical protein [Gemmatimonadaceae bacterium]
MTLRTVTDTAGRTWTCSSPTAPVDGSELGRDVEVECTSPAVDGPVRFTVGWQWASMSDNGLARQVSLASPVPRR